MTAVRPLVRVPLAQIAKAHMPDSCAGRSLTRFPQEMIAMALANLTDEQRKQALEKAAAARKARAELRGQIKSGDKSLADVFAADDDPIVARMKVSMLLESIPGYGKAKAAKLMDELEISPSRRIKGLGIRQREELLKRFGGK